MRVCFLLMMLGVGATDMNSILEKFMQWTTKFEKNYENKGEAMIEALKTFMENLAHIEEISLQDPDAVHSHMTPFMDWSRAEFTARNTYTVKARIVEPEEEDDSVLATVPKSFDWRHKGAVQKVKDQEQCGSCWAFGTIANIESANVVQGGNKLLSLSEQELVDCSKKNAGCNGGDEDSAKKEFIKNGWGFESESSYPYKAKDHKCQRKESRDVAWITGYKDIGSSDATLMAALVKYGVLSIGVNANPWQYYEKGILNPWLCPANEIDHAVNLVGYGSDDGKDYWTVRNSWGVSWGEKGYIRMIRGKHGKKGVCGMKTSTSTAIVAKEEDTTMFV